MDLLKFKEIYGDLQDAGEMLFYASTLLCDGCATNLDVYRVASQVVVDLMVDPTVVVTDEIASQVLGAYNEFIERCSEEDAWSEAGWKLLELVEA